MASQCATINDSEAQANCYSLEGQGIGLGTLVTAILPSIKSLVYFAIGVFVVVTILGALVGLMVGLIPRKLNFRHR